MAISEKLKPNVLYRTALMTQSIATSQVSPNLYITGGTVNVFGSNTLDEAPTSISEMVLPDINASVTGFCSFEILPRYMYIQGTDDVKIVSTGVSIIDDLGEF